MKKERNNKISAGERFGRWTVVEKGMPDKWGYSTWVCKCACGTIKTISQSELLQGRTKSCGCYRREYAKQRHEIHGGHKERLYEVWHGMKRRCNPLNKEKYPAYAGRGIKVCEEWANSYENFKQWAFANGYNKEAAFCECTIDRIDVNGDYCPENCRWVNMKTQCNNRRNTIYLTLNGKTKSISAWADEIGISLDILYHRYKTGWSDEKILTQPVRKYRKGKENGSKEIKQNIGMRLSS